MGISVACLCVHKKTRVWSLCGMVDERRRERIEHEEDEDRMSRNMIVNFFTVMLFLKYKYICQVCVYVVYHLVYMQ